VIEIAFPSIIERYERCHIFFIKKKLCTCINLSRIHARLSISMTETISNAFCNVYIALLCLPCMKAPAKVLRSQRPSNGSEDARYKSNPYSRFYCIHLYIIDAPFTPFLPRVIYHMTSILRFAFDNKYFRMQILLFSYLIRKLLQSIL
jgi:hypothetical protein